MAGIFGIGHSNVPREKLLERLQAYGINRVVDVRTKPYSRFSPQYNRNTLEAYLAANGIVYDYRGLNLGGLGENIDYQQTLEEIVALADHENITLMCSEKDYHKCHRYTMLAPDIELLGKTLEHISYE